jgi:hypothetical protein
MILLITIWGLALVVVLGALGAAFFGVQSQVGQRSRGIPATWWDMYILTYQDLMHALVDVWHDFMPHVHNATTHVLSRVLAWRDRTYAKLFGYPAVPHGGVVSFFLKRIVEHKEEFRQKVAHRRAVYEPMLDRKPRSSFADMRPDHKAEEHSTK